MLIKNVLTVSSSAYKIHRFTYPPLPIHPLPVPQQNRNLLPGFFVEDLLQTPGSTAAKDTAVLPPG